MGGTREQSFARSGRGVDDKSERLWEWVVETAVT